jgi:hypothetical protein
MSSWESLHVTKKFSKEKRRAEAEPAAVRADSTQERERYSATTLLTAGGLAATAFFGFLAYQQSICENNYRAYELKMDEHRRALEASERQVEQLKLLSGSALETFLVILRGTEAERQRSADYERFLREQLSRGGRQ